MLTSVVSTVPGTVAVYQPAVEKAGDAISAPGCGALATSCNCQPLASTTCGGGVDSAEAVRDAIGASMRTAKIDVNVERCGRWTSICNGFILKAFAKNFRTRRAEERTVTGIIVIWRLRWI